MGGTSPRRLGIPEVPEPTSAVVLCNRDHGWRFRLRAWATLRPASTVCAIGHNDPNFEGHEVHGKLRPMQDDELRGVLGLPVYALAYVSAETERDPRAWVEIALDRWREQYERPGYLERLGFAVNRVRQMRDLDLAVWLDLEGRFSDAEIRAYLDLLLQVLSKQ